MRVTRTSQDHEDRMTRKAIANRGCNVCPCCGETKTVMEYFNDEVLHKGIFGGLTCKSWAKGLFRLKYMQTDCYSCETCGAKWESDPYEKE